MSLRRVLVAGGLLLVAACSSEGTLSVTPLELNDAPPGAMMRAGYLTVTNTTSQDRTLVSARSNAFGLAEFHRTRVIDGKARMREEKNLIVAANDALTFEPFGLHVMLMRPQANYAGPITIEICFDNEQCLTSTTSP